MKILIAVPTAEATRHASFYDYLTMLEKPLGSLLTSSHGQSPARNRNMMIEQAIKADCSHILFLDDDVTFQPDLLNRLLSHDKDIVTGLYLMRDYPHKPIIFSEQNLKGEMGHRFLYDGDQGLIEIINCGLGCVLIKIEVFKAIQEPWITLGDPVKDHWCDDITFFNRAREAGFKLYCDLSALVGHMTTTIVAPEYINGKWCTSYNTNGPDRVVMPMVVPAKVMA